MLYSIYFIYCSVYIESLSLVTSRSICVAANGIISVFYQPFSPSPLLRPRLPWSQGLPRHHIPAFPSCNCHTCVPQNPLALGVPLVSILALCPLSAPFCWTLLPSLPGASPSPSGYANSLSKNTPALPGQGVSASFLPSCRGSVPCMSLCRGVEVSMTWASGLCARRSHVRRGHLAQ